ncbi:helix-turn-helix domain-containing protein, partial [Thermoflexus sp.]|uniref:helix-turn-helix domain-containing protein n=1 Tax=Thermoflexus sp. TaxID=1969742 RepID=UPI003A101BB7
MPVLTTDCNRETLRAEPGQARAGGWDAGDADVSLRAGSQRGAAGGPGQTRGNARFAYNWGLSRCLEALEQG